MFASDVTAFLAQASTAGSAGAQKTGASADAEGAGQAGLGAFLALLLAGLAEAEGETPLPLLADAEAGAENPATEEEAAAKGLTEVPAEASGEEPEPATGAEAETGQIPDWGRSSQEKSATSASAPIDQPAAEVIPATADAADAPPPSETDDAATTHAAGGEDSDDAEASAVEKKPRADKTPIVEKSETELLPKSAVNHQADAEAHTDEPKAGSKAESVTAERSDAPHDALPQVVEEAATAEDGGAPRESEREVVASDRPREPVDDVSLSLEKESSASEQPTPQASREAAPAPAPTPAPAPADPPAPAVEPVRTSAQQQEQAAPRRPAGDLQESAHAAADLRLRQVGTERSESGIGAVNPPKPESSSTGFPQAKEAPVEAPAAAVAVSVAAQSRTELPGAGAESATKAADRVQLSADAVAQASASQEGDAQMGSESGAGEQESESEPRPGPAAQARARAAQAGSSKNAAGSLAGDREADKPLAQPTVFATTTEGSVRGQELIRPEAPKPEPARTEAADLGPRPAPAAANNPTPRATAETVAQAKPVARPSEAHFQRLEASLDTSSREVNRLQVVVQDDRLGRVSVRLVERAGLVDAMLRADNPGAARSISDSLSSLTESLARRGLESRDAEMSQGWQGGSQSDPRDSNRGRRQQRDEQSARRGRRNQEAPSFAAQLNVGGI